MYCRSCKNVIADNTTLCHSCNQHFLLGEIFCPGCGKSTSEREVLCFICGHNLEVKPKDSTPLKLSPRYNKLYRSKDERGVSGILSGLSHKFSINIYLLRITFTILMIVLNYYAIVLMLLYLFSFALPSLPTKNVR